MYGLLTNQRASLVEIRLGRAAAVEVHDVVEIGRAHPHVLELQAELPNEASHRAVPGVDVLAASLGVLSRGEPAAKRVHAAAHPSARLEHSHAPSCVAQAVRRDKPGEPGAHHDHAAGTGRRAP